MADETTHEETDGEKEEPKEEISIPQEGSGVFVFVDGSRYEGMWKVVNGVKHRHGTGRHIDGPETYEGEWVDDMMHGKGSFHFASGAMYQGEWFENKFHGYGLYRWADGAVYTGEWREGRMHGEGCYNSPDGIKFEGNYFNGKFQKGETYIHARLP